MATPTDAPRTMPLAAGEHVRRVLIDGVAIGLGCAVTLSIYGYRFGEQNHTVYLLDALRRAQPELLRNDWFTTQTLQYHAVFGIVATKLIRSNLAQPVFLASYLLLVVLFHVAWLRLVKLLGGGHVAYVTSLVLYYASAAGTGLGMYQFFQDSSLLPSNIANVAMLWALCFWTMRRLTASGACFGVAGLFHLNHAVVGVVAWVVLCAWEGYAARASGLLTRTRPIIIGSVLALTPAMLNILLAATVKLQRSGAMPLGEFVELYVRLRHPHHYDPSSWPVALWVAFLWPIPIALSALRRDRGACARRLWRVSVFILALQLIALLTAGVWYASESLVQMSLYRFSIFIQLIACAVVATVIAGHVRSATALTLLAVCACTAMIAVCLLRGPFFGAFVMPEDDAEYVAVCDWARAHTPLDAVLLVPPGESSMRLRGRRAIVVNFKAVPQLSGELPEWRDRLRAVLALDDLRALPRGYRQTLDAIDQRSASRSTDQLVSAARRYGARYIVSQRALDARPELRLTYVSQNRRYFVYDRGAMEDPGK